MKRIVEGVFQLEGIRGARVYLLTGVDGSLLVDAGAPRQSHAILDELRRSGHQPSDVKAIVVTHCHADHVGSLDELANECEAEVWAHADEATFIEGRSKLPFRSRTQRLFFALGDLLQPYASRHVDRTLSDGEQIDTPVAFAAIHVPGHTPGSLALHLVNKKLAIIGDALFGGIPFRGALALPPSMVCVDPVEARKSAAKLAELDLETICQGHGPPVLRDAVNAVRNAL